MSACTLPLRFALTSVFIATLAACGGGDDSDGGGDTPGSVALKGTVVIDQPVAKAAVCLDLNANAACDAGEPTTQTAAGGTYELTATSEQVGAGPLIALMTPDVGAAAPYALRQVRGKAGQINPLTTLVAAGVQAGMTESSARANAALQLGIAEAKIDNYQDDAALSAARVQDSARTMASVVAAALAAGATLEVGDQTAASDARPGDLLQLRFGSPADYFLRTAQNNAKAAGPVNPTYRDVRTGADRSVPITELPQLYPTLYLTSSGWKRCTSEDAHISTRGNPNRGVYCSVNAAVAYVVAADVAGQRMADVITTMHADAATNTLNNGLSTKPLLDAVADATFPAGATSRLRTGTNLNTYYFINDSRNDFRPAAEAATLEALIDAKPAAKVNLATAAGSLTLGLSTGAQRNLRVAFTGTNSATSGTVQFYDCALNADATVASDCSATQTGTYTIETVNGARIMSFAGHAPTTASGQINYYGQVTTASGERVARVRQTKPDRAYAGSVSRRLNPEAWAAMKARLGV
ncbi:hypothetical protein FVQ98_06520 [Ottowia sp. GY511]|uniref:Lipoprotein n=1 Tax=Ottowia flava TaxID=2675430 RepID=A0ABW4KTD8_9BURK|nr:hypothetical protein [Ottowia sp. GY511]TXK30952.1 hypothetical protein FVQ98_06520 [Ottowia sp. GY511]